MSDFLPFFSFRFADARKKENSGSAAEMLRQGKQSQMMIMTESFKETPGIQLPIVSSCPFARFTGICYRHLWPTMHFAPTIERGP